MTCNSSPHLCLLQPLNDQKSYIRLKQSKPQLLSFVIVEFFRLHEHLSVFLVKQTFSVECVKGFVDSDGFLTVGGCVFDINVLTSLGFSLKWNGLVSVMAYIFLMSALLASQGWAQQGQRLAWTRIKPMRKFEFVGPYLLATCGVLRANGRIWSFFLLAKHVFMPIDLSNMTIENRRDSWRGLQMICFFGHYMLVYLV